MKQISKENYFSRWKNGFTRNLNALFFGVFVASTSILDWYVNSPLRYKPFTDQELQLYLYFRVMPKRVMSPPDFTIGGIMLVLAFAGGYFFLGILLFRLLKTIELDSHEAVPVYLGIAKIFALLLGGCASFVGVYGAYMLPTAMKLWTASVVGVSTFWGTDIILRLPYRLFKLRKKKMGNGI